MRSERKDAPYRRAKAEGYRARSALKLKELDDRHHFLGRARRVVDLGAWPGGWLQVAVERCPQDARIVGIDLETIDPLGDARVQTIVGDLTDPGTTEELLQLLGGPADLILCDAAPKLTGISSTDRARMEEIGEAVIDAVALLLEPRGSLVMKLFTGPAGDFTRKALGKIFPTVRATRPNSTRRGSSELYVLGLHYGDHPVDKLR
jgi:23S rRNA (uridine2552-2'-O)-methyltransferase